MANIGITDLILLYPLDMFSLSKKKTDGKEYKEGVLFNQLNKLQRLFSN